MNHKPSDAPNVVPLHPNGIRELLTGAPFQWWIAGGRALDLFLGEQTRSHFDTDVAIARKDQSIAQQFLFKWEFQYTERIKDQVVFHTWETGQILRHEIPGVWARPATDSPFRFEFLFHEIEEEVWSFRYFGAVQHPLSSIEGRTQDGIRYLNPEVALLYKAARMREVDTQDFQRVLPRLDREQRSQLIADIHFCWPEHPWLELLR
jgi:hypothetical protein